MDTSKVAVETLFVMISGEHGIYIYTNYSQISNNFPFVSGQFYLRTLFSIPVVPPSQTLYSYIPVSGHSLVSGSGHS